MIGDSRWLWGEIGEIGAQWPPGLLGIPLLGIPLLGIPLLGIPLLGIPLLGIPLLGIPLLGIPLFGIPLLGMLNFSMLRDFSYETFLFYNVQALIKAWSIWTEVLTYRNTNYSMP